MLDAVGSPVFGVDRYPTLVAKACAIADTIARGHVFQDGNKKTALEVLFLMLELNDRTLLASDDELVAIMYALADNAMPAVEFVAWVEAHLDP